MTPTDNIKSAMLRELALARFPDDVEVADAMRRVQELAGQQLGDTVALVVVKEAVMHEGFRSIVNQKISYGCEQESQDLI
jgi:hypothetical protein